jgi:aryl-alcohol dehydrogenase-like predicted oxidoreductase
MEYRQLGQTGLNVSALGFGCGSVGGLLVRGEPKERVRAVARAIESGITYFDTARAYGDGRSERNLGAALEELAAGVVVGTKVDLTVEEMENIEQSIIASVEGSLRRLRRDTVDLIQLHNPITDERQPERGWISVADVGVALQAFEKLQTQGKARFYGINGLGDTNSLHQAIGLGQIGPTPAPHTIQSCYNLINPSAGVQVPAGFAFQDYRQLIDAAADHGMGAIAIRVLAAGALSGSADRAANAAPSVAPIGTGQSYAEDVRLARRFSFLVEEGCVESLVEAAIRFVIGKKEVSTMLVGISNLEQLEQAVTYANRGPLPAEALGRLPAIWGTSATEA